MLFFTSKWFLMHVALEIMGCHEKILDAKAHALI